MNDDFIHQLRLFIIQQMDNPNLSPNDLSAHFFISRTQIHRRLKAHLDISTGEFIQQIRMEKAKDLLQKTDKKIIQIAYEVGYKDASYFSRVFNQQTGMSPKLFRQKG